MSRPHVATASELSTLRDLEFVARTTVEGLRHKELPIMSAQYHPEASPGPKDTSFLFDEFAKMLEGRR